MTYRNKKHNCLPSKEPHVGGDVAVGGSHGCDQENTIECHEASSTDSRSTASASPEHPEHHTRTRSYPDKPEKAGRSTTVSILKFISGSNSRDTKDEDISYYKCKARRYKSKRKKLRIRLEGTERELDKLKKENKELNAKFKVSHNNEISMADNLKVTQKVASAQERRANGLEVAIQNMQLYVGPQADDEVLKATFGGQLTGKVRTWSAAFVTNNQPAETYVQTLRNSAYAILSPIDQALELLREKRKRRLFVEGMVGSVLASNIFRTVTTEASIKPQNPVRPTVLEYSMDKCFAESISVMEQNLTNGLYIPPLHLISNREP